MTENAHPTVLTLMGPTASGKTSLAMALAERHNCEIISVDSALIYRGMDIGTAKPSAIELARAPHRLINIIEPNDSYSVANFRSDCIEHIELIIQQGKTPLLVGGTMLYFKGLLEGLSPLPAANEAVREEIMQQSVEKGWHQLHQELAEIDPISAQRIHPNDPQRLSRALEVYKLTGKTLTELTKFKSPALPYNVKQFAIAPKERKTLHENIALRFEQMLIAGFVDEVEQLRQRNDLHIDLPSMRSVGYRQCWQYLDGEFDHQNMVDKSVAATRQLAKRQLTWLRNWSELTWLETGAKDNLIILKSQCD